MSDQICWGNVIDSIALLVAFIGVICAFVSFRLSRNVAELGNILGIVDRLHAVEDGLREAKVSGDVDKSSAMISQYFNLLEVLAGAYMNNFFGKPTKKHLRSILIQDIALIYSQDYLLKKLVDDVTEVDTFCEICRFYRAHKKEVDEVKRRLVSSVPGS